MILTYKAALTADFVYSCWGARYEAISPDVEMVYNVARFLDWFLLPARFLKCR